MALPLFPSPYRPIRVQHVTIRVTAPIRTSAALLWRHDPGAGVPEMVHLHHSIGDVYILLNQKACCSNDPGASVPEMGASADDNNGIVSLII